MKYIPFNIEQHIIVGKKIKNVRLQIMGLMIEHSRHYKKSHKAQIEFTKAMKSIDAIKDVMDSCVHDQYKGMDEKKFNQVCRIYYGDKNLAFCI